MMVEMRIDPETALALVRVIEHKDRATAAHTWRVVLYTRALAEASGISREDEQRLTFAAALHDVGKLDIPDEILGKAGPLTDAEFAVMKTHAALGHQALLSMGEDDPILLNLVRHHHERFDGLGYPDGLAGEAIPLVARWFAVIDSFDAMTSVRPYRAQVGDEAARRAVIELQAGMGTRYAPEPVEAFANLFHTGELDWILHYFNDQVPIEGWAVGGVEVAKVEAARKVRGAPPGRGA
jgi:HD-GYP domain-containing protein (c-di-GMP phosphodiesterase class II)